MKKIGFVDYYISEWHANNYVNWIKDVNEKLGTDYVVAYAYAELDVSPVDGRTTDEWCKQYGVEKCNSIEEICEKSDNLIILAPSDPQTHLGYAEKVLKYKKNTYIDKTFAPDFATAKKIFELGKAGETKFFSSSALRYGAEMEELTGKTGTVTVFGDGRIFEEYVIHIVEMLVAVQGTGATKIRLRRSNDNIFMDVCYDDHRKGTLAFCKGLSFKVALFDGEKQYVKDIATDTFLRLIESMLKFFETGEYPFDPNQTLEVIKIREKLIEAQDKEDIWLDL